MWPVLENRNKKPAGSIICIIYTYAATPGFATKTIRVKTNRLVKTAILKYAIWRASKNDWYGFFLFIYLLFLTLWSGDILKLCNEKTTPLALFAVNRNSPKNMLCVAQQHRSTPIFVSVHRPNYEYYKCIHTNTQNRKPWGFVVRPGSEQT